MPGREEHIQPAKRKTFTPEEKIAKVNTVIRLLQIKPEHVERVAEKLPSLERAGLPPEKLDELKSAIKLARFAHTLNTLDMPEELQPHVKDVVDRVHLLDGDKDKLVQSAEALLTSLNKDMCKGTITREKVDRTKAALAAVEGVYDSHGLESDALLKHFKKIVNNAEESCK